MAKSSSSLFDNRRVWRADPKSAFDSFVVSQRFIEMGRRPRRRDADGRLIPARPIRAGSAMVYMTMFARFLDWLDGRKTVFGVSPQDIQAFLDAPRPAGGPRKTAGRALNSQIRVRYLRMLERVYGHLKVLPNPAQIAAYNVHSSGASGRDAPMVWLRPAQSRRFVAAADKLAADEEWVAQRDRALLFMLLGAGLTVAEVTGLYVSNLGGVVEDGSMPVEISPGATGGVKMWHTTMLRPFAVPYVEAWAEQRKRLRLPGKLLFPSRRQGRRMDATSIYLLVRNTLTAAGIDVAHMGPRTLRNTFVKRELEAGTEPATLMEYLGFAEERSLQKYLLAMRYRPPARG